MSFISFSFSIIVDLFNVKIAGYTFIWTTYETERWTNLYTVGKKFCLGGKDILPGSDSVTRVNDSTRVTILVIRIRLESRWE